MRVSLGAGARADLDHIFATIVVDNPSAAADMLDRLYDAIRGLADFPHAGRVARQGDRELVTVRPYVIVYVVDRDGVRFRRIFHAAQRR